MRLLNSIRSYSSPNIHFERNFIDMRFRCLRKHGTVGANRGIGYLLRAPFSRAFYVPGTGTCYSIRSTCYLMSF